MSEYVKVRKGTGQRIVRMLNSYEQARGGYFGATGTAIAPAAPQEASKPSRRPAVSGVTVKITGNASGGGQYVGRILTGNSTADGSGNLAMPEGRTVPDADNALILNLREDGMSTHGLNADTFHLGLIVGTVDGGTHDGKTIVEISSFGIVCQ